MIKGMKIKTIMTKIHRSSDEIDKDVNDFLNSVAGKGGSIIDLNSSLYEDIMVFVIKYIE